MLQKEHLRGRHALCLEGKRAGQAEGSAGGDGRAECALPQRRGSNLWLGDGAEHER